jgi:hypothetical protein
LISLHLSLVEKKRTKMNYSKRKTTKYWTRKTSYCAKKRNY